MHKDQTNGWISLSERLPSSNKNVLIARRFSKIDRDYHISIARFVNIDGGIQFLDTSSFDDQGVYVGFNINQIDYWMNLPTNPPLLKEQKKTYDI